MNNNSRHCAGLNQEDANEIPSNGRPAGLVRPRVTYHAVRREHDKVLKMTAAALSSTCWEVMLRRWMSRQSVQHLTSEESAAAAEPQRVGKLIIRAPSVQCWAMQQLLGNILKSLNCSWGPTHFPLGCDTRKYYNQVVKLPLIPLYSCTGSPLPLSWPLMIAPQCWYRVCQHQCGKNTGLKALRLPDLNIWLWYLWSEEEVRIHYTHTGAGPALSASVPQQCCNEYSDSDSNLFLRIPNIRIRIRDFCKTNIIRIRIRNRILTSESESF